jgi:hypothetical protein
MKRCTWKDRNAAVRHAAALMLTQYYSECTLTAAVAALHKMETDKSYRFCRNPHALGERGIRALVRDINKYRNIPFTIIRRARHG